MSIKSSIIKAASTCGALLKEHSPEILIGAGIVSIVAGTVEGCRATLKAEEILDEHKEAMDKIHKAKELEPKAYLDEYVKRDTTVTYIKTIGKFAKLYAPTAILITGGIGCILWSHKILSKRLAAVSAAYTIVSKQFEDYRGKVVEKFGEEVDRQLRYNFEERDVDIVETDKDGKEKKKTKKVKASDIKSGSDYAVYYHGRPNETVEEALNHLLVAQKYANDYLHAHGYLPLNSVYEMIDSNIEPTDAGLVVGWVENRDEYKYVDFGINGISFCKENLRFYEDEYDHYHRILLDFNIDSEPIYGRVKKAS